MSKKEIKQYSKKTTNKKVKVIGEQEYFNNSTGEVENFQVISMEDRDFNFEKLWLVHILESLEAVGNKKIMVMNTLLKMKNSDNQIIGSQRQISKESGVSLPTVNETINILIDSNFIRKITNNVYMINPDILFKGGNKKRMNVLLQYKTSEEDTEEFEEKQLSKDPDTFLQTPKSKEDIDNQFIDPKDL
jgi:DNA-binding transcriptional regulator YhcF (GntR family)